MKQVSRKFLEEQVKKALNETGVAFSGGQPHYGGSNDYSKEHAEWNRTIGKFAKEIFFGMEQSWDDVTEWYQDTGLYGFGGGKYYAKAVDSIKGLQNDPLTQTSLRFFEIQPVKSDSFTSEMTKGMLSWRKDIFDDLFNIAYGTQVRVAKHFKKPEIDAVMGISSVLKEYMAPKIEDFAEDYGFEEGMTIHAFSLIASNGPRKMPGLRKSFKETQAFIDNGMYDMLADQLYSTRKDQKLLGSEVEKIVLMHFNGLEEVDINGAKVRMGTNPKIGRVLQGIAAFNHYKANGIDALLGAVDLSLSIVSSVAMVVAIVGSLGFGAPAVGAASAAVKETTKFGIKRFLLGQGVRATDQSWGKFLAGLHRKNIRELSLDTVRVLDGLVPQLLGTASVEVTNIIREWNTTFESLVQANVEFKENYKDKTPAERETFYINEIEPILTEFSEKETELLARFKLEKIPTKIAKKKRYLEHYRNFDLKGLLSMETDFERSSKEAFRSNNLLKKQDKFTKSSVKDMNTVKAAVARANQLGDQPITAFAPVPEQAKIQQKFAAGPAPAAQASEPAQDSIPEEVFVAGDSIAVGIRDAGANSIKGATKPGLHTYQVLDLLRTSLKSLQEQKYNKVLYISTGINDAIAYASTTGLSPMRLPNDPNRGSPKGGTAGNYTYFTPEATNSEIDKIVSLAKNRGYSVVIRKLGPVPYKGSYTRMNSERFNQFCEKVNAHIEKKGYKSIDIPVSMMADGFHPTRDGYKKLFNKIKGNLPDKVARFATDLGMSAEKPPVTVLSQDAGIEQFIAGNILFVGDSITVGMGVFGAKTGYKKNDFYINKAGKKKRRYHFAEGVETAKVGETAAQILRRLKNYFKKQNQNESLLREQKEKIMIVSAGTNDAIGYAQNKGAAFNADDVVKTIQEIVNLGRQNGYAPRVMPLMPYTGGRLYYKKIFNNDRYQKYIDSINASDVVKNNSFDSSLPKSLMDSDGIHPKINGYIKLFRNAISGVKFSPASDTKTLTDYNPYQAPASWGYRIHSRRIEKNNVWEIVKKYSRKYNFDPLLHMGLLQVESGYRPRAIGYVDKYKKDPKNPKKFLRDKNGKKIFDKRVAAGKGIAQFIDSTAKKYGVNQFDVDSSIDGSIRLLLDLKKLTEEAFRKNKDLDYDRLSEGQKLRLMLYGYHGGVWGSIRRSKTNEEVFRRREAYYERIQGAKYRSNGWRSGDYSLVIFEAAERMGFNPGAYSRESSALPVAAPASPSPVTTTKTTVAKSNEVSRSLKISKAWSKRDDSLREAQNFEDFATLFLKLFNKSGSQLKNSLPSIERAVSQMKEENLSNFAKLNSRFLQLLHKRNFYKWKSEYDRDIRAAAGDAKKIEAANKKLAYYHRPIVYAYAFVLGLPNIDNVTRISFAFEPNNNKNYVHFGGDTTFYKQDYLGNTNFKIFISKLQEIRRFNLSMLEKLEGFYKTEPVREKDIDIYKMFITSFNEVLETSISELSDNSETALRKGYIINILDKSFKRLG